MREGYGGGEGGQELLRLADVAAILERRRGTIVLTALACALVAACWSLSGKPSYRAQATLVLEPESRSDSALAGLSALGAAPAAESEMSILRSRALAELTAADGGELGELEHPAVFEPTAADGSTAPSDARLGLSTEVLSDDLDPLLGPLRRFLAGARGAHRLRASVEAPPQLEVGDVRIRFVAADRLRISRARPLGLEADDAAEHPYAPGAPIEHAGATYRLVAAGDYAGASFRVRRRAPREAVESLLGRTSVVETARNSGVIRVTVTDADPWRAAETANALARNYVRRSVEIGSQRATRTARFLEQQLERRTQDLREAELDFVAMGATHPEAVHVTATAAALIGELAENESERTRVQLARVALAEAVERLAQGDLRAVSRLSRELPDLLSAGYVEAIGKLTAESLVLERSDAGAFKHLLQTEALALSRGLEELELRAGALAAAAEELSAGDAGALARLTPEADAGLGPAAARHLSEIAALDAEIARLAETYTPAYPPLAEALEARADLLARVGAQARSRLASLELALEGQRALQEAYAARLGAWPSDEGRRIEHAIEQLTRRVREHLSSRLEGLVEREQAIDRRFAHLEAELARLPESERLLAEPLRRREALAKIVETLLESHQQARIREAATMPSAVLVDPAVPAERRNAPNVPASIAAALIAGLALGVGLGFLRDTLSGSLFSHADIEEATDLTVLGAIPDFRSGRLRVRGADDRFLPVRDDPYGIVAESYRSIRENLRFLGEKPIRTFAVTSCTPGEGKTTTNIDLAMSFATRGRRVLIVDGDLRRPTVHERFGISLGPGLAEALSGDVSWRDLVRPTGFADLEVLTAGTQHGLPGELLGSDAARALVRELAEAYDHVVFDLPPALVVADVESFAHELDALLLLYRSGGVARDVLRSAAARLRRTGAPLAGVIVNAVRMGRREMRATYGAKDCYGYGYGYGREHGARRGRGAA